MNVDPFIQAMFGRNAIHIPFNMIVQQMSAERPAFLAVAQAEGPDIAPVFFNHQFTHTLIAGDIVMRPRLVIGSEHLVGRGISGVARDGFLPDEWISKGKIILQS